tara:strand:- start:2185 stop:2820 length:636 start_codon:yes stop_codon:yes gene_type:complete
MIDIKRISREDLRILINSSSFWLDYLKVRFVDDKYDLRGYGKGWMLWLLGDDNDSNIGNDGIELRRRSFRDTYRKSNEKGRESLELKYQREKIRMDILLWDYQVGNLSIYKGKLCFIQGNKGWCINKDKLSKMKRKYELRGLDSSMYRERFIVDEEGGKSSSVLSIGDYRELYRTKGILEDDNGIVYMVIGDGKKYLDEFEENENRFNFKP